MRRLTVVGLVLIGLAVGLGIKYLIPAKAEATPFYTANVIKQYVLAQSEPLSSGGGCSAATACSALSLTSAGDVAGITGTFSGAASALSYAATAASAAKAYEQKTGARMYFNSPTNTSYIHSATSTVGIVVIGNTIATFDGSVGLTYSPYGFRSDIASGSTGFGNSVNGAYIDYGAGSFDRANSNGTIITFDAPLAQAPGRTRGVYAININTDTTLTLQGLPAPSVSSSSAASVQLALTGATRKYIQWDTAASTNGVAGIVGAYTATRPLYRPTFSGTMLTDSTVSSRRVYFGLAESTTAALALTITTAATAIDYVAVGFDTAISANWLCCSGDGTTHGCESTGVPVAVSTEYSVVADWKTAGTLRCCVNGTCVNKTANLSTQAVNLGIQSTATTLANTAINHWVSSAAIEQN